MSTCDQLQGKMELSRTDSGLEPSDRSGNGNQRSAVSLTDFSDLRAAVGGVAVARIKNLMLVDLGRCGIM